MTVRTSHAISGCRHSAGESYAAYETGTVADAREWVYAADLSNAEQSGYLSFLRGFPELTFTRELERTLHECECRNQLTLPSWYREAMVTLSFVHATGSRARARFDGYDFDCYCADRERETWREIGVDAMPEDPDERDLLVERAHMHVFGGEYDTEHSALAVNLADSDDRQIYGFSIESLWDADYEGDPPEDVPEPLFASYAGMLSHIVELSFGIHTVRRLP